MSGQNSLPDPADMNRVNVIQVTDLNLAIFLMSVGVNLRKDPPYKISRLKNGHLRWMFHFETMTRDGKDKTMDLVKKYIDSDKYIYDNPNTLETGAICALKNMAKLLSYVQENVKPWVAFRPPGGNAVSYCIEGSNRHRRYVKNGWIRCDPNTPITVNSEAEALKLKKLSKLNLKEKT